ncbi:MAG: UDP-N-acetylglucosamine 1-carboxyvinyltransferase [bacterium]|nr:UDP-N-acetylglucosamine 1-carboxyvinyltransferase [bacterium]
MSKTYIINGGNQLHGQVKVSGSRNAVTKMMIASLLSFDPIRLKNVPEIGEVQSTMEMLEKIGTQITWDKENKFMHLTTPEVRDSKASVEWHGKNRLPMLLVAPLLHRFGHAEIPLDSSQEGAQKLVDYHIEGYKAMGAIVEKKDNMLNFRAGKLKGATITLPYPSVSATENLLLAAVLAEGKTVIKNVAVEPEVIDLTNLLQKMGAVIFHEPGRMFVVEGVGFLNGAEHSIIPDRIEVASFACVAIATQGSVFINGAVQDENQTLLNVIKKIGGSFSVIDEGIAFSHEGELKAINLETGVHPGFMTDWQPPFSVVLTQCNGASVLHETVHEQHFSYIDDLVKMGADVQVFAECLGSSECRFKNKGEKHSAIIKGPTALVGGNLMISDIHSAFAYVLTALVATGTTRIKGVEKLERGFDHVVEKLAELGADITVEEE